MEPLIHDSGFGPDPSQRLARRKEAALALIIVCSGVHGRAVESVGVVYSEVAVLRFVYLESFGG